MFKNEFGQVKSGYMIAAALLTVFIGQGIFMLPGMTLMSIIEISKEQTEMTMELDMGDMSPLFLVLTQGAATFGGLAATLVIFRAINKKNPNKLGVQGPAKDMMFGLVLGAGVMTIIFALLLMTGQITLINALSDPQFSAYTLAFVVIFILTGFFEEMFFRGYVMKTMIERNNKRWVIYVVSALVFGLVHITNPNVASMNGMVGIVNIILVGFLFAYMFETTKSLMLPIGFHITWNFFQGSVYGFSVSGIPPHGLYELDIAGGNDLLTGGTFGIEGGLMATLVIVISFFLTYAYTKKRQETAGTLLQNR